MANGKKTPPHKGLTGYSLHIKRLLESKGIAKRSVKYPLVSSGNETYLKELTDKVFKDYESIVGDFNIDRWVENKEKDTNSYSLIDFWVDSLRMGIVFAPSAAKLVLLIDGKRIEKIRKKIETTNREFHDSVKNWEFLIKEFSAKYFKHEKNVDELCEKIIGKEKKNSKIWKELYQTVEDLKGKGKEEKDESLKKKYGIDPDSFKQKGDGKLTFCPLPELKQNRDKDEPKKLIEIYKEKYQEKKYKSVMGLENNFNALSNYWNDILKKLWENKTAEIKKQILDNFDIWSGKEKEKELEERIKELSRCSKKLPKPELTSSWAAYRTSVGGKIQSYVSNLERQEKEIEKRLKGQIRELEKIQKDIDLQRYDKFSEKQRLVREYEHSKKTADKLYGNIQNLSHSDIEVYRDTIGSFRHTLNRAYQQCKNENPKTASEEYENIHSDLQQLPEFPGKTAKKRYEKYRNSWQRVKSGTDFLKKNADCKITKKSKAGEDKTFFLQRLNSLKKIYGKQKGKGKTLQNGSMNTARFAGVIRKAVKKASQKDLYCCGENDYFYRNPHSRNKKGKDLSANIQSGKELKTLKDLFHNLRPKWDDIISGGPDKHTVYELLDAVEIEKWRSACAVYLQPDMEEKITDDILKNFEKAKPFLEIFGKDGKLSGEELGRFINEVICSELRGTLSRMTREEFIVRATVQFEKLNKTFHREFHPKDKGDRKQWVLVEKENERVKKNADILKIRSSKYQTQFLDVPQKFHNLEIEDYSLIAEKKLRVGWKNTNGEIAPVLSKSEEKDRLFVSIPFKLSGKDGKNNGETKQSAGKTKMKKGGKDGKNNGETKRLLGIDTGEKGLAYTVLETFPKLKIVKEGFISHPSLEKIRDYIRLGKTRQRAGVFREESTKIAKIRENAIGALRNRIHDIALRYKAKPVYEYNISNFETKSGRISKVYKSVKRADVKHVKRRKEIEADKYERKLVWGKADAFGEEVKDFATSNICSSCGESIYIHIDTPEKKKENFNAKCINGEECEITVDTKQVKGIIKNVQENKFQLGKRETIDAVREFSRKPLDKMIKKAFKGKQKEAEDFREKRGNRSVFECPFCGHISDADIQASLVIALKQYLTDKKEKDELKKIRDIIKKNPHIKIEFKETVAEP